MLAICAGGGLTNLALDGAIAYLEGRKMSAADALQSLGAGCALDVAGVGAGVLAVKLGTKLLPKVAAKLPALAGDLRQSVVAGSKASPCSFAADTPVTLADGTSKPIAEVEEGEEVLAWDEGSNTTGRYRVVATWAHDDPATTYLNIAGERIVATPEHPFYTRSVAGSLPGC